MATILDKRRNIFKRLVDVKKIQKLLVSVILKCLCSRLAYHYS